MRRHPGFNEAACASMSTWTLRGPVTLPGGGVLPNQILAGQKFGSKLATDLDISYTFARRFTLTLGALNIFNTYPDKIKASPDNPIYTLTNSLSDGQIYPRSGGPFGTNGGFWYAKVKIKY